jgi:putative ABC transport system permease protein
LGKYLKTWGREAPIGGVVQDFNTTSLHQQVEPVLMLVLNRYWQAGVKIDLRNAKSALAAMEEAWNTVYPEYVFDYTFLDESIANFYESEQNTARLMNIFTLIAIIIGCMGLFGLVSNMAAQRTKEIGIRKVLGATVSHVLALLSKDFLKLVLLANIFAWPVAWYAMKSWLQDFAYRIDIGWWIFALSGGLALAIALLTVSYQAIRAALANPVEALRYE